MYLQGYPRLKVLFCCYIARRAILSSFRDYSKLIPICSVKLIEKTPFFPDMGKPKEYAQAITEFLQHSKL